jgi:C4-dicarboxylate transporter DctM subunit
MLGSAMFMMLIKGIPFELIPPKAFASLDVFPFLAIPGFILAGSIMTKSGIAEATLDFAQIVLGRRIGGSIGTLSIIGSALFGTVTGSSAATIAAVSGITAPEMLKRGYSRGESSALLAAAGFLGILIPPSVPGIMYAIIAEQSILAVWLTTIGPGIVLTILYILIDYFLTTRRNKKNKVISKSINANEFGLKSFYQKGRYASPGLFMPVIIFGGIYGGIFTPTEAAVVAVFYGLIIGVYFYRKINTRKEMFSIFKESAIISAVISILIALSSVLARVATVLRIPEQVGSLIGTYTDAPFVFLLLVNIFLLIVGMFMETNSAILICVPILYPASKAFGIDPLHFAAVVLLNLEIGMITPPFAGNIFVSAKLLNATFNEVVICLIPYFLFACLPVLLLTTIWPELSLIFPKMLLR